MVKWYLKLDSNHKVLFVLSFLGAVVFFAMCPLFFLRGENNYPLGAVPVGWLLGSLISIVSFYSITKMSEALTKMQGGTLTSAPLSLLGSAIRFLLYAAGLVVSAISTFRPEWFGGFNYINFFSLAGALLPMLVIVLVVHFRDIKRVSSNPSTSVKEEKK